MKQIRKAAEPTDLTEWRIQCSNDPNFGYTLIDSDLRAKIQQALLDEQGRIDAYTEQRIWEHNSHIEHLKAQTHCTPDEKVSYTNMVACYPGPNPESDIPYGAICKGAWPPPKDEALFVSPLSQHCEQRFCYNEDGSVEATSEDDIAAQTTIRQLNLITEPFVRTGAAQCAALSGQTTGSRIAMPKSLFGSSNKNVALKLHHSIRLSFKHLRITFGDWSISGSKIADAFRVDPKPNVACSVQHRSGCAFPC